LEAIPLNDLSRIDPVNLAAEIDVVAKVISSGHYMKGKFTADLESKIADLTQACGAVTVANGTDALMLAMLGLGVQPSDFVATAPNAGGYASTAAIRIGAVPVLVDIDPKTTQMSPDSLEKVLVSNESIRAVVVTHLYGLMADVQAIRIICDRFGVLLIEDCAQAFGASLDGRIVGSWGDASTFSFYPTKNLGALGDGGAISFKNEIHLIRAKQLSQYGWSNRYEVSLLGGVNSRIDEIQAAVLLLRLERLNEDNKKRREIVSRYQKALTGNRRMIHTSDNTFVGHLAIMITTSRDSDTDFLNRSGVGTGIHYPILDNHQPAWLTIFSGQSVPMAEVNVEQIVTLPCFPKLEESEIEHVCKTLKALPD
jgi:dTDP-3-amino-2,3,6-trideoxy-4-keto-D-glucose/dTDP-3-amino-3,4,6-trideoxy-alpha-D-glucose/dTDP-2,6-dideoxy-D-kanosamine transaminase